MLLITVPAVEFWDERIQEFVNSPGGELQLEHSLVSISKWESKWHVPYLSKTDKTYEETIDYIKCMTINEVDPRVYSQLTNSNIDKIAKYINDPMTATTISKRDNRKGGRPVITSEVIYYWMVSLNIPLECENWHFNRLITLIEVCNAYNAPPKKMSKRELMNRNAALNAARRNQLNTKG